ncbi:MAG TPA: sulfite exporter TauE/SafE family protein, partial [Vitreimonas sp.]|nr:sulfite exporter TauE/SafE family protein [Vitreimonas sp.]
MLTGLLMLAGGAAAGVFGSLLGLGGGILIVPLLTLGFGLELREAVGVSLVSVIVTSGASAGVFLERRVANLRLGMTLELFTAIGALAGGLVAFLLSDQMLAALFAALLIYVALSMARARGGREPVPAAGDEGAAVLPPEPFGLDLSGPDYQVRRFRAGAAGSVGAGVISALLGVGGGLVKVPVMHLL